MAKQKKFNGIWINQDDFIQFTVMTDKQCKALLLDLFEQFDNIKNFHDVSLNPFDKNSDPVAYLARERFINQIQTNHDNYIVANTKEVEAQQKRRLIEKLIPNTKVNPKLREVVNKFCSKRDDYEESVTVISNTLNTTTYKDCSDDSIINALEYAMKNDISFVESIEQFKNQG